MDETAWRTGESGHDLQAMLGWIEPQLSQQQRLWIGVAWMRRIWDLLADNRFREVVEVAEGLADGTRMEVEFNIARGRLPQITNWRPPEPPPLADTPNEVRFFSLGQPRPSHIPPPGVLNFPQLPWWVRQTHYATGHLSVLNLRGVHQTAADARADYSAEHTEELKPFDEQIDAINWELDRYQREHDDAVWRGMSAAAQKAADLRQRREEAEGRIRELRDQQRAIRGAVQAEVLQSEFAAQADLLRCVVGNPFRPMPFDPGWRTETVMLLARGIDTDRAYDRLPILADALEEAGCDTADLLTHCRSPHHARGCHAVDAMLRTQP